MQINKLGQTLLDKYKVLANSLNFFSGIKSTSLTDSKHYEISTGKLVSGAGADTMAPMQDTDLANL